MRLIIFFMTRSAQFDRHTSGRREGDSHGYENLFHDNGVEAPVPLRWPDERRYFIRVRDPTLGFKINNSAGAL